MLLAETGLKDDPVHQGLFQGAGPTLACRGVVEDKGDTFNHPNTRDIPFHGTFPEGDEKFKLVLITFQGNPNQKIDIPIGETIGEEEKSTILEDTYDPLSQYLDGSTDEILLSPPTDTWWIHSPTCE
jgi:hypothetical protein